MNPSSVLRLAAVMEAAVVTGPARNLMGACRRAMLRDSSDLSMAKLEPLVTTFVRQPASSNAFTEALAAAAIPSAIVPERYRFDPRTRGYLRDAVASHRPDIVQTHNVKSHFLLRLTGLPKRFPWIAFHHGYTATDVKMHCYNQLDRWSLRGPRLIVTVCRPFADELKRSGIPEAKIRILHNSVRISAPVQTEVLKSLRARIGVPATAKIVLGAGRFSREKGFDVLIAAFARFRALHPKIPAYTVLLGDGPERPRVESAAEKAGIGDRVVFAGHVPDMAPWYGLADVFALSSRSEGSPNVVLEAMAAGVPVAATAVGGVPELIDHEATGLLIRSGDAEGLARAIARMLSEPELPARLAANALRRVRNDFQPESYDRSLFAIYREVLEAAGPVTSETSQPLAADTAPR